MLINGANESEFRHVAFDELVHDIRVSFFKGLGTQKLPAMLHHQPVNKTNRALLRARFDSQMSPL